MLLAADFYKKCSKIFVILKFIHTTIFIKYKELYLDASKYKQLIFEIYFSLEKRTRHLPTSTRTEIYGHSAQFTPCTKETLARRAKKLHVEALETRISSTKTKYLSFFIK